MIGALPIAPQRLRNQPTLWETATEE